MIPPAVITGWAQTHPWSSSAQVEQDLALSRALVEIFQDALLADALVFRGGTALHKLLLAPAARYSEDLDFVQRRSAPIGVILDRLQQRLNPWLGEPRRKVGPRGSTLVYRFSSELPPVVPLRLKIEINTREHFQTHPLQSLPFAVDTRWYQGEATIPAYAPEELLGTKVRALYQRRKGRDLFDIWHSDQRGILNPAQVVPVFLSYMEAEKHPVSAESFAENLQAKLDHPAFLSDTPPLLRPGIFYDPRKAAVFFTERLLPLMPKRS
jgi:predicted nucleotidyltransferase component of viral defense system